MKTTVKDRPIKDVHKMRQEDIETIFALYSLKDINELRISPSKTIEIPDYIGNLKYIQVMNLRSLFGEETSSFDMLLGIASIISEKPKEELLNCWFSELVSLHAHIKNELIKLDEFEKTALRYETTPEEEEAGVERMAMFGEANTLDAVAKGDLTKWDAVRQMKYNDVLTKLLKDKEERQIAQNYERILKRNNKTNGHH